uniref:Uncharacterized protein n=1 Tax=Panagrolaimus sp. PS1159 TaxID=55785 RepID=A0AC35GRV7_9BILA
MSLLTVSFDPVVHHKMIQSRKEAAEDALNWSPNGNHRINRASILPNYTPIICPPTCFHFHRQIFLINGRLSSFLRRQKYRSTNVNAYASSSNYQPDTNLQSLPRRPPIRVHNLIPYEFRYPPIQRFDESPEPPPTCFHFHRQTFLILIKKVVCVLASFTFQKVI